MSEVIKKDIREGKKLGDNIELTKEGVQELKDKLEDLINVQRPNIVVLLKAAREQGDISENADYDSARNQQSEIEMEILRIEDVLSRVKILSSSVKRKKASIGSVIDIQNIDTKKQKTVRIVGQIEYDSFQEVPKISPDSPIAKGIIGKEVNDICLVEAPIPYKVKILKIN